MLNSTCWAMSGGVQQVVLSFPFRLCCSAFPQLLSIIKINFFLNHCQFSFIFFAISFSFLVRHNFHLKSCIVFQENSKIEPTKFKLKIKILEKTNACQIWLMFKPDKFFLFRFILKKIMKISWNKFCLFVFFVFFWETFLSFSFVIINSILPRYFHLNVFHVFFFLHSKDVIKELPLITGINEWLAKYICVLF